MTRAQLCMNESSLGSSLYVRHVSKRQSLKIQYWMGATCDAGLVSEQVRIVGISEPGGVVGHHVARASAQLSIGECAQSSSAGRVGSVHHGSVDVGAHTVYLLAWIRF